MKKFHVGQVVRHLSSGELCEITYRWKDGDITVFTLGWNGDKNYDEAYPGDIRPLHKRERE